MAPRGNIGYGQEEVKRHIRSLFNHIVKQAQNIREAIHEMIYTVRAAYRTDYLKAYEIIEPRK